MDFDKAAPPTYSTTIQGRRIVTQSPGDIGWACAIDEAQSPEPGRCHFPSGF